MNYEKSCGAAVLRERNGIREYLLVFNKKGDASGHWGFPKGHIEDGETELECAAREIFEETGLRVKFIDGFRRTVTYSPKPETKKDAVYFACTPVTEEITLQLEEVAKSGWFTAERAAETITYNKELIEECEAFLNENNIGTHM